MSLLNNQQQRIVDYLVLNRGGITQIECSDKLRITKLSTRICEMEAKGYVFAREWEHNFETGTKWIRYFLIKVPPTIIYPCVGA